MTMLHIVKMLERRYPGHAHWIVPVLVLISLLTVLVGIGLVAAR